MMKWLWWSAKISAMMIGLVGFVLWLSVMQAVPVLPDPDAFYHIGMAQNIVQFGLADHFTGLQPTTLGQHFTDHHLLMHVVMYPFVTWIGPVIGTKVFIVLALVGVLTLFAWMLKRLGTPAWWAATILLAVCNPWIFRLQLIKATPLALILIFCAVLALHVKRPLWLLGISAIYVLSHGGFILLPLLGGIWCISETIVSWRGVRQVQWKPYLAVAYTLLGAALTLLIHPAFPQNLLFYWEQIVQIGAVNYQHIIGVGGEWYPYDPAALWFGHLPLILAGGVGVALHIIRRERFTVAQLAFAGYTLLFVLLTLKSKRYVEYVSPMLAASVGLYLQSAWRIQFTQWRLAAFIPVAGVIIVLTPVILSDLAGVRADLADGQAVEYLSGAGAYLASLPDGQTIAPSDWDDFPAIWRGAPQQQYLIGLDPTFLYLANTERYQAWKALTLGESITTTDLDLIDAQYYLVVKDHKKMYQHLTELGAVVTYEDGEAWVLKYR